MPKPVPLTWVRGPAYFEPGAVQLHGGEIDWYELDEPGLLDAFMRVDVEVDSSVARFVRTYGLLWAGPSWDPDSDAREFRVSAFRMSEPRSGWSDLQSEILIVQHLYRLSRQARKRDALALKRLRSFVKEALEDDAVAAIVDELTEELDVAAGLKTEPGVMALASILISGIVIARMLEEDVRFLLVPAPEAEGVQFAAAAKTIAGYVVLGLVTQLIRRVDLAVCPECGRVFEVENARRRYCEPKCATRGRVRRYRAKA